MLVVLKRFLVLLLVFGGAQASAGVISYSGSVDASDALYQGGCGTCRMDLQPFWVDVSATYSLEVISADFDTYLFLFVGVPNLPSDSASSIASNDDGGTGLLSLIDFPLSAGTQYSLGTRGFGAAQGSFTTRISGEGGLSLGLLPEAPVPAPGTLVLLGLGFAGLGWARRRKA